MSPRLQFWLLLGCAWVGTLQLIPALRLLGEGWRGPYANGGEDSVGSTAASSNSVRVNDPTAAATPVAAVRERVVRESDVAPGVRKREPSPVRDVLALAEGSESSSPPEPADSSAGLRPLDPDGRHRTRSGPASVSPVSVGIGAGEEALVR